MPPDTKDNPPIDPIAICQNMADKMDAEAQALKDAERKKRHADQLREHKCAIIPFPRKLKSEPFRSELIIEQSSIFVSNAYKGDYFSREWETKNELGERIVKRLSVGKINKSDEPRGVLRQVHQDAFYKLLQLWAKQDYRIATSGDQSFGSIRTTVYEMVQAITGEDSAEAYRKTQILLRDMSGLPIVIEHEQDGVKGKDRVKFSLLNGVEWKEINIDKETNRPLPGGISEVTILFSSMITEGFLDKRYKTLLGEPYRALGKKGELARLLYPYLDAQLATKDHFHIKLRALAERFGFAENKYKSLRKQQFANAIKSLNGKLIGSEEYVLRVSIKASKDDDDYVLQASKQKNKQIKLFEDPELT